MSLTVVGSVAFDALETPFGKRDKILGGAGTHFSLSASFFTQVNVVGVVGGDFTDAEWDVFRRHHINVNDDKAEALKDSKTFLDLYYSADYSKERLESWLTYGSPRDCIEHLKQFKASGCRRITFRISSYGG